MFGDNLLESSPSRQPVLKPVDRLYALLAGVLGIIGGLAALTFWDSQSSMGSLVARAAILGAIVMCCALMVIYVYRESRHLGLKTWAWCGVVLLLNLAGFILFLIFSATKTNDWKRATIPIAYAVEICLVGVLVLAPLIHTATLGKAALWRQVLDLPAPPPPPPAPSRPSSTKKKPPRPAADDVIMVPRIIPNTIDLLPEDPAEIPGPEFASGIPGGLPGGTADGVPYSIWTRLVPPPPPPVRARVTKPRQIRISHMEPARLIYNPAPEYLPLAKMARIEGTVRLEAVIGIDGRIQNLKSLSGHPLLVGAALEAVARWRYQPTLLNGEPVEVLTEVDVIFHLAQ